MRSSRSSGKETMTFAMSAVYPVLPDDRCFLRYDKLTGVAPALDDVLDKAAQLQELVPGAVLVGGSAAALYAHHRESLDHDHVVIDLEERFDSILENLEALGDWSTARVMPGKIILGE